MVRPLRPEGSASPVAVNAALETSLSFTTRSTYLAFASGSSCALALLLASGQAYAYNECGVATAPAYAVECDDTLNPYTGGITYTSAIDRLTLTLKEGLIVERQAGMGNDAVTVWGSGNQPLAIVAEPNVLLKTTGGLSRGIEVRSVANSSIDIVSAANIDVTATSSALSEDSMPAGLWGHITDSASAASIAITQAAGSTINVHGADGYAAGIHARHQGLGDTSIVVSGDVHLTAGRTGGGAVSAASRSTTSAGAISVTQHAGSTVTATGYSTAGVKAQAFGTDNTVSVDIAGTVQASGDYVNAVQTSNSAGVTSITVRDTAAIVANGQYGYGVRATTSSGGTAITFAGSIETFGRTSDAVSSYSANANSAAHSIEAIGTARIVTRGEDSPGLSISNTLSSGGAATIRVRDSSSIETHGKHSYGVALQTYRSLSTVELEAATSIVTLGERAYGVLALGGAQTNIDIAGRVEAHGQYASGVAVSGGGAETSVIVAETASIMGGWQGLGPSVGVWGPTAGVAVDGAGTAKARNAGTIGALSDLAITNNFGLNAYPRGSVVDIENRGTITGFMEFLPISGHRFTNTADGVLELRHFADIDGDGTRDTKRVAIADFGDVNSTVVNAGTLRLAPVAAAVTIDTSNYYVPTTGSDRRQLDPSFYDLARDGLVQAQFVNLGTFSHSGIIDLRGGAIGNTLVITGNALADGTPGGAEFVANGGTLLLNAVLNEGLAPGGTLNSRADMLVVDGTRLGTAPTAIHVSYDPDDLGALTTGNGIQLVEVLDKTTSAAGVFTLGNRVAAGAYEYTLHHHGVGPDTTDGNWYLRSTLIAPEPEPEPQPAPPPAPVPAPEPPPPPAPEPEPQPEPAPAPEPPLMPEPAPEYPAFRAEVPTYVATPALAHRFGLDMLGSFRDRGSEDANSASSQHIAAWGRVFGFDGEVGDNRGDLAQQYRKFTTRGASYEHRGYGLQAGLDLLNDNGTTIGFYLGAGAISADVDAVYGGRSGAIELKGYSVGGYWVRKQDNGAYLDLVLQGTRYEGDLGFRDAFDPTGWAAAVSLEGAYPFDIARGWTLEPQAQLVAQRLDLDGGRDGVARIDYDSDTALYGRIGTRAARTWHVHHGQAVTVAGELNLWHDFDGTAATRISTPNGNNRVNLATDLGGTWGEMQLTVSASVTPLVSAFVSGNYSVAIASGSATGFGGHAGVRVRF